ncbi:hypothetical protein G7070_08620 [Propioniciclava coleopterorum]|uniref:Septum formation-related domain-containing protein n=1 Tax=Propioniciclava coleopterorum TaxID=2714937 RepID=A0A6G7Y699_9ACTN|nr:septum formation family protein [Propioniciclava coleopterorum]QIK72320.1 hypothetical protein G7070_08620 [Propioniciclava coleopterorum]
MSRTALARAGSAAVAVAAALTLAGCSLVSPAAPSGAPGPPATEQPAAAETGTPGAESTATARLPKYSDAYQIGSCLALTGDAQYLVPPVPCSEAHEEEVFGFFEFPDGGYPDEAALQKFLRGACDEAFTRYVGMEERDSKYGWYGGVPGVASYERGGREGVCLAFADIHDITNLPVLTGSIKGTNE